MKRYFCVVAILASLCFVSCEEEDTHKTDNKDGGVTCDALGKIADGENCVCDAAKHFVADGDACICDDNYHLDGKSCVSDGSSNTCEGLGKIADGENCVCDAANHFVVDANGDCVCDVEYELKGSECKPMGSSDTCEGLGKIAGDAGACVCDAENHFVADASGDCVCDVDFELRGSECKPVGEVAPCEGLGKIAGDAGACVCDAANHFVVDANGDCVCDVDFELRGSECKPMGSSNTCDGLGKIEGDAGACICDVTNHFVPDANGDCVCDVEYELIGSECKPNGDVDACDGLGEIEDSNGACICDASKHFTDSSDGCVCEVGHYLNVNVCDEMGSGELTCSGVGKVKDNDTNSCVCNAAEHWEASSIDGECVCEASFIFDAANESCVPTEEPGTDCDGLGEIKNDSGQCVCNEAKSFVAAADGSCVCDTGYYLNVNVCLTMGSDEITCSGDGVIKDNVNNSCVCNAEAHWVAAGSDGECVCDVGYHLIDHACEADT